jgi:uncharacterized membrane protein
MTGLPGRVTAALLFLVLAFCIYRARTQNLIVDEAFVFQKFVNQPLSEMAKSWDACNHVLHTLMMKWFRDIWGIGEVVLRLPTLIGAALYLAAVYRLTRLLFSGWGQPLAAALLVLHPLLADHLVAARGYGLAAAFFMWALYCAISYYVRGRDSRWLTRAGILAGLSVAANLTFAFPVSALGISLLVMECRTAVRMGRAAASFWRIVDSYFGPALVIAALIVMIPLLQAQRSDFYFGHQGPLESLRRLFITTLKSEHAWFTPYGAALAPLSGPAIAALFLAISVVAAVSLTRGAYRHYRNAPLTLTGATLAFTGLLHCLAGAFGVPYPSGRTGIYLIPLFTLPAILLFRRYRVGAVLGLFAVFIYISENDPRYFTEWRYDAGTREMIRRFDEDRHRRNVPPPVTLGVVLPLRLTTEYYQLRRGMPWMKIARTDSPEAQYLLLDSENAAHAESPQYEIVAKHASSGAVLARRRQ